MGLFLGINKGGTIAITPASSVALDVTIDGTLYSEAWDTDVATTIDNWITSFAGAVSEQKNILATDGTTTLDLYNVDVVRSITSANATVGDRADAASVGTIPLDGASYIASGTNIALTIPSAPSSADIATFSFADAASAVRGVAVLDSFIQKSESTQRGQDSGLPATVELA